MERYLKSGERLELKGISGHYIIKDIIGRGSSCVVYSAEFYNENNEKTEHLLKEFNPKCIDLARYNGELKPVRDKDAEHFNSLCTRFKAGFDLQGKLRFVPELKNYTANIQNTYYDHGTMYIDMTETEGRPYADVEETSLYNLAQRIRVLAQVIGNYHKQGYLHLDIKPSNIFVRPEDETCQDVLLFDFDSLVPFHEENGKCILEKDATISYTTEYAPIELISESRRNKIGKATDIYEIGEIFFEKLMGRHSTALEHNTWADYEYNFDAPILKNVNPKVYPLLDELFHHTLSNNTVERYQSAEELISCLDEIIEFSIPNPYYLDKNIPSVQTGFVGRKDEIEEIHKLIEEHNILFLSGIGGIGKTELAKKYANDYQDYYTSITTLSFLNDIATTILNAEYFPYNLNIAINENPDKFLCRKITELKKMCNKKTLVIVDNLDSENVPDINILLDLGCKIIITTRCDFSQYNKAQLIIDKLQCKEEIREIFDKYYQVSDDEESKCVDEIIDLVEGHTMTVELIAKQIEAEWVTADEILKKLKSFGISGIGVSKVDSGKDNQFKHQSAYDHIKALFDLSVFEKTNNENALYILANLSLIPHSGIDRKLFSDWCALDENGGHDCIKNLIKYGWVREHKSEKTTIISLHPLISEVCQGKAKVKDFSKIFKNITSLIDSEDEGATIDLSKRMLLENLAVNLINIVKKRKYESPETVAVLLGIGNMFYRNIKYNLAEDAFILSLNISEKVYEYNSWESIEVRASIGLITTTKGAEIKDKIKIQEGINILKICLENVERFCAIRTDAYEAKSTIYNYLGMAYEDLSDNVLAIEMYQKGKNILEQLQIKNTGDYLGIAIAYNNIGRLYYINLNSYDLACENYEKAIYYFEMINNESPHFIKTLYHLGLIYVDETYDGFNLSRANTLSNKVFFMAKKLFDNQHPLYIHSVFLLGKTEYLLGNKNKALNLLEEAYEVYKQNLNKNHSVLIWLENVLNKTTND